MRDNRKGHETPFARRITPTCAGRAHPCSAAAPPAYDALTVHSDEVEALPDGAKLLATNAVTHVQAAEIRTAAACSGACSITPNSP